MAEKVAFRVLFPAVPETGKPVKRQLELFIGDVKVQDSEIPLEQCTVRFVVPYETESEIYTRTADKAGNWSDPSMLFVSGLTDVTPPPAPPAPKLVEGEPIEVDEEVGFSVEAADGSEIPDASEED